MARPFVNHREKILTEVNRSHGHLRKILNFHRLAVKPKNTYLGNLGNDSL